MNDSHDPTLIARLEDAVLRLPRIQRDIFLAIRLDALSYADIAEPDLQNLPPWAQPWSAGALRTLGLREAASASERLQSFGSSLSGVDAGQWPSRWQDYALNRNQVLERSRPLAALRAAHPTYLDVINQASFNFPVDRGAVAVE